MLAFDSNSQRRTLHSRQIFQTDPIISSDGVTKSSVTVFGNLDVNNNSGICCQIQLENTEFEEMCTTLILYGKVLNNNSISTNFNPFNLHYRYTINTTTCISEKDWIRFRSIECN